MLNFFNPFRLKILTNTEISKPLYTKLYKSLLALYTVPFSKGDRVSIDKYSGVVQRIDIWYLKLKSQNRYVFIPTSFIYDQTIEVEYGKNLK